MINTTCKSCENFVIPPGNFNLVFVETLENLRLVPPWRSSSNPPPAWLENGIAHFIVRSVKRKKENAVQPCRKKDSNGYNNLSYTSDNQNILLMSLFLNQFFPTIILVNNIISVCFIVELNVISFYFIYFILLERFESPSR